MTFLNPLFLLGLLGTAVPLVIHMLSRRTARRQDFPTLEFLRDLDRKSMRRVRVRQWLLLLLRMAIVAAVAIAMARPTLTGVAAGGGRGETSAAIVLDGSFSMGARAGGDGTLFDAAKRRADSVLDALETGDEAFVIVAGTGEGGRTEGLRDLGLARERVDASRPGEAAVDLPEAVGEAARALEGARHLNREIHVISDFQRGAWPDGDAPLALPEGTGLFLHPVGDGPPPAAWIEPVDVSGQILEPGVPIELRTSVAAGPGFPAGPVEVELEIDGALADRRRVDLAPASRVALTFRETFVRPGLHRGSVVLRGAPGLDGDDRRNFVVRTERAVPVRLVAGDESARRFLHAALAPEGAAAGSFAVTEGGTADLVSLSRAREAVVILADVDRLADAELAGIKAFLSEGGGVLVFPGARTDAAAWGRTFLPRFLPGTLGDRPPTDEPFRIGTLDPVHPLFDLFRSGEGGLGDVQFTRALRFRPQAGTTVLASFTNGDPAIVESSLLPGRVLFVASALDPAWSDLALTGAFVPLVHESVRWLSQGASRGGDALDVGEGTVVRLAGMPEGGGARWRGPDDEERAVGVESAQGGWAVALPRAERPGFWILESTAGDTLAAVAVNVAARESDPTRLGPDELAARRGAARGAIVDAGDGAVRTVREARLGREIGRAFLWAAVLLLLAEMALAQRFRAEAEAA